MPDAEARRKPFLYYVAAALGKNGRLSVARHFARKRTPDAFSLPDDLANARSVLIILPEDLLGALRCLADILSLTAPAKDPAVTILCATGLGGYFETLYRGIRTIEYDIADRWLFSPRMREIAREIASSHFDILLFLEPDPDPALLALAGRAPASLKIARKEAGGTPFFNIRVPAATGLNGALIASSLGLAGVERPKIRWAVSREILDETAMAYREAGFRPDAMPIGIDAATFRTHFGEAWTTALIAAVATSGHPLYLHSSDLKDAALVAWLAQLGHPVFARLSPPRTAALLQRSHCIIAGKSALYQLAALMDRPAIGIFDTADFAAWVPTGGSIPAIAFSTHPDETTIAQAVAATAYFVKTTPRSPAHPRPS